VPATLCFMARALDDMNIDRDRAIASELANHAAVEFQIAHLLRFRKMVIYWSRGPVPFFGKIQLVEFKQARNGEKGVCYVMQVMAYEQLKCPSALYESRCHWIGSPWKGHR
jgi:hypothetical protein